MGPSATICLSILSLFLINSLKAQTGKGCFLKTCSQPGLVRIDAILNAAKEFVGGCTCGCDPGLTDPSSPKHCAEPKTINWDAIRHEGDCSCSCPATAPDPASCIRPTVFRADICGCGCPGVAPTCTAPQEFRTESCRCGCSMGDVNGPCIVGGAPVAGSNVKPDCTCDTALIECPGNQWADPATGECGCPKKHPVSNLWLPICTLPTVQDPITCDCVTTTTTLPPAGAIEVECSDVGDCSCPFGTNGACTITCDGTNDACKDGIISCNNDGATNECIVNCMGGSACAGATTIKGPVGGKLTVNCIGSQSCEGSTTFNGQEGTDLTVVCEGDQSCKGNVQFNFGNGKGTVACNGRPDSCQGATAFNLLPNAETIPGAAFSCTGAFCPPDAPAPFSIPGLPTPPPVPAPLPAPATGVQTAAAPAPAAPAPGASTPAAPAPGAGAPGGGQQVAPQAPPQAPQAPPQAPAAPQAPATGGGGSTINNVAPVLIVQPNEIVICEGIGAECTCSGTRPCTVKCESPDACKEATLTCPTNHDCTIMCMDNTCLAATINGGDGTALVIEANGISALSDSTVNSIEAGDVDYRCIGKDSCKATQLNCGRGDCTVTCDGEASCDSSPIIASGARSFTCMGMYALDCPPDHAPPPDAPPVDPQPQPKQAATPNNPNNPSPPVDPVPATPNNPNNPNPPQTPSGPNAPNPPQTGPLDCAAMGPCPCTHLQCFEERVGTDCHCECPDSIIMDYWMGATDICGPNSGAQEYIDSACSCDCPANSEPVNGCPASQTFNQNKCQCECSNGIGPSDCVGMSQFNPDTCQCECGTGGLTASDCRSLGKRLDETTCECGCINQCAGPAQIQSPTTCRCACPFGTPQARDCISGVLDPYHCECAPPLPSTYCCQTISVSGMSFKPWQGRCWHHESEDLCVGEPNKRCQWEPNNCHDNPPRNDYGVVCNARSLKCTSNEECCSEICRIGGVCR